MADLDEFDLVLRSLQCTEHTVDTVAGVPEDAVDAPLMQAIDEEVTHRPAHRSSSCSCAAHYRAVPFRGCRNSQRGGAGETLRAVVLVTDNSRQSSVTGRTAVVGGSRTNRLS